MFGLKLNNLIGMLYRDVIGTVVKMTKSDYSISVSFDPRIVSCRYSIKFNSKIKRDLPGS